MKDNEWITLDYLEFFCQKNQLLIGCKRGEEEMWISALGPHPSTLTSEEVNDILRESSLFEVRRMLERDPEMVTSTSLTRAELEAQIRGMMN